MSPSSRGVRPSSTRHWPKFRSVSLTPRGSLPPPAASLTRWACPAQTHRQSPTQIFQAYACDLTDPSAAASTLHTACRAHPSSSSPDYVFACAGGCVPGFFTDMPAAKHWECMEWNFRTCLNTVHEAVCAMKKDGKEGGRVVLTSSVLALMSFAGYSTYSPSKYAIRGTPMPL